MAVGCDLCNKKINKYHDYVECNGECNGKFHIGCVDISIEVFTSMKESNVDKNWLCPDV